MRRRLCLRCRGGRRQARVRCTSMLTDTVNSESRLNDKTTNVVKNRLNLKAEQAANMKCYGAPPGPATAAGGPLASHRASESPRASVTGRMLIFMMAFKFERLSNCSWRTFFSGIRKLRSLKGRSR